MVGSSSNDFVMDVLAGSIGGLFSEVLDYPFDTAKVLMQTSSHTSSSSSSSSSASPTKPKPRSLTVTYATSAHVKAFTTATATKPLLPSPIAAAMPVPKYKYSGTLDCVQQSIRDKGLSSLYKGFTTRLVGGMLENGIHFVAYATIKREVLHQKQLGSVANAELSFWELAMAGAGSGAVMSLVTTPVELIKCRMQVAAQQAKPRYANPIDCIVQTVQQEGGLKALYKGHVSTMYREVPGSFCWYLTYEVVCEGFLQYMLAKGLMQTKSREDLPMWCHLLGGAAAGVMYWTVIFPVDTVKSILQTQNITNPASTTTTTTTTTSPFAAAKTNHMSFQQALLQIYQQRGFRGLYRGWGATALRAAPADAVLFAGYEQTLRFLKGLQSS